MSEEEKEAIYMLETFIINHKFYNIKQSDGLEDNIKITLNLIENQQKELNNLKEIEQEHKKENGELRKRVTELEEERQIVGMPVRNKRDGRIGIVLHQWKSGSVAVLESINPRVINTHDSWNTLEIVTDEVKQTQTKCETIPVSLVKEKIEELNKAYEDSKDENGESEYYYPDYIIRVLEELLEKRK